MATKDQDDTFTRAIDAIERLGGAEAVIRASLKSIGMSFHRTKDTELVALQPTLVEKHGDL